jgi:hypothetical protein
MASPKTKTNDTTETNGVPASTSTATTAVGTEASTRGTKLRWTSLKGAVGVPYRTKEPKAKKLSTSAQSAKTKKATGPSGQLSALDAAAKVLQDAGQAMNCQELIQAMAANGYWTSPAGKTPSATLYASIMRETKTKGSQARFQKTSRGHFVYHSPQAS